MSSTRQHPAAIDLGARRIALLPVSGGTFLEVELTAGCEQFIGRFARLERFRFGDGMIRFRTPEA